MVSRPRVSFSEQYALKKMLEDNLSFAGHSLGGGLASG